MNEQDHELLQQIERNIDEAMEPWKDQGVFVKLNTRSPKDVYVNGQDDPAIVEEIILRTEEELSKLPKSNPNPSKTLIGNLNTLAPFW